MPTADEHQMSSPIFHICLQTVIVFDIVTRPTSWQNKPLFNWNTNNNGANKTRSTEVTLINMWPEVYVLHKFTFISSYKRLYTVLWETTLHDFVRILRRSQVDNTVLRFLHETVQWNGNDVILMTSAILAAILTAGGEVKDDISVSVAKKYSAVPLKRGQFSPESWQRHPIARPWGRGMGCVLWVQLLIKWCPSRCSAVYNTMLYWTAL